MPTKLKLTTIKDAKAWAKVVAAYGAKTDQINYDAATVENYSSTHRLVRGIRDGSEITTTGFVRDQAEKPVVRVIQIPKDQLDDA
jgi:hypothetical protein